MFIPRGEEARREFFSDTAFNVASGLWLGLDDPDQFRDDDGPEITMWESFDSARESGSRIDFIHDLDDRVVVALRLDKDYRFLVTFELGHMDAHAPDETGDYIYRVDVSHWTET